MHPVNWDVWNVGVTEMAKCPPALDDEFYFACHQFLLDEVGVDLSCDITESNAFDVYVWIFVRSRLRWGMK